MELIAILFVIAIWDVSKSAVKNARAGAPKASPAPAKATPGRAGKSASRGVRQRQAGYWIREGLHGFPAGRTGWHAGWLAHRAVLAQQRNIREAARTNHLETERDTAASIREHRTRQAEAQREIEEELAAQQAKGSPATGRKAVRRAADEVAARREQRQSTGWKCSSCGAPDGYPCLPGCAPIVTAAPAVEPEPTRRVDGQPESDADRRFFDQRESGYDGPLDRDGNIPPAGDPDAAILNRMRERAEAEPGADASRNPQPIDTTASPTTQGEQVAADTNYDIVMENARKRAEEAEQDAAAAAQRHTAATQHAEDMQAVGVQGGTMTAQMDLVDQLKKAEEDHKAIAEQAVAVRDALTKEHGGIKAAVDDAPIPRPAETDFYVGS
jgi:hypothetical protein